MENLLRALLKKIKPNVAGGRRRQRGGQYDRTNQAFPAFCLLVVSKECTFRCKMCNMWKNKERDIDRKELTLEEIKGFVDDLKKVTTDPIFIHLIGGEALLRKDLIEILSYIRKNGYRCSITTNGFYIDRRMARRLVSSGLTGIFLSLDGMNPHTHDYLRGIQGSHKRVMRAIELLDSCRGSQGEDRLSIGVTMTLMEKNLDEVLDVAEWANRNEKIDDFFVNACLQPFDCESPEKEWFKLTRNSEIWPQDIEKAHGILEELAQRKEKGYNICNPPEQLRLVKEYFRNPYRFVHDSKIRCPRGDLAPEINAYGDINMCFAMPPVANIRDRKFSEVWFSPQMQTVRARIQSCRTDCDVVVNCFYKIENITDYIAT